jgi:hypothetical protein
MDLTVGDALYLYTICPLLPDSSDFLLYKESLFLWFCIEPPRHARRRPVIQQKSDTTFLQRTIVVHIINKHCLCGMFDWNSEGQW